MEPTDLQRFLYVNKVYLADGAAADKGSYHWMSYESAAMSHDNHCRSLAELNYYNGQNAKEDPQERKYRNHISARKSKFDEEDITTIRSLSRSPTMKALKTA